MLSLVELERAAGVVAETLAGSRVERFVQPAPDQLVLTLYAHGAGGDAGRKRHLLLSVRREVARVSELAASPKAPANPPAFVSYLRAHLSGARLVSARSIDGDRQLGLRLEGREGASELVLCLLGNRSNLYLLDAEGRLVLSLRPLAETRPELERGAPYVSPATPLLDRGEDRWSQVSDARYLAAIEAEYARRDGENEAGALERELRRVIRREARSARRRLEKIEAELAEADRAGEYQRWGELLKGALGRIEPGASELRVRDYETDEEVCIPLDPTLSPRANLEATFKRYQKLLRRLTKAGGQIDAARDWCAKVEGWAEELAAAGPGEERVSELAKEPELARLLAKSGQSARPAAGPPVPEGEKLPTRLRNLPRRLVPKRYRTSEGLEIWVGKDDACNDHLTTKLARGNDLFFHLDGSPGSHVILRTGGRADPPSEAVLDACELAVHFSKQRNAGRADVHMVPIKQVKKPKGAKPGLVWVTGGRSVHLRREEKRLERILAARIDD